MSVRIGISPIAWQNDDLPELTSGFTMDQALSEARTIGYTGVERGRRMPRDTEGLRAYLNRYGLDLCGGWCSGNLMVSSVAEEIDAVRSQVEQFAALQAPCLVYAECSNTVQGQIRTPLSSRPKLARDEIATFGAKLSELAKWMAGEGMVLAYHHHMGSMIEDEEDIDALMDNTSREVKLLFDTGHLAFAGGNVIDTLDRWGDRIAHVHFKDIRPRIFQMVHDDGKSFLDAVIAGAFTVPGDPEGMIDFQAVTDALAKMSYEGWIVIEAEQDPAKANPYDYSRKGYDFVTNICGRSGLTIET
jgi:inosose dehydratase